MTFITAVLAHPDADSFCASLYASYLDGAKSAGGHLRSADLYRDGFDPVMDESELRRHVPVDELTFGYVQAVQASSTLALFFPDWWGAEPAILKGWLERILRQDIAYARGGFSSPGATRSAATRGLLTETTLRVVITSDSSASDADGLYDMYRRRFDDVIGRYCGFRRVDLMLLTPVRDSKLSARRRWLEELRLAGEADAAAVDAGSDGYSSS
jgi:NAD(P)H dehydrogenase (quinone)